MMTRMERATATWALALRGGGRSGGTARQEGVGAGGADGGLAEAAAQVALPWPFFPAGSGAGLAGGRA